MNQEKYVVGIDLGTSNITLSYGEVGTNLLSVMDLGQIASPGKTHKRNYLPAYILLQKDQQELENNKNLPWQEEEKIHLNYTIGSYAQEKNLEKADHVVSSAKSWLCHKHIAPKDPLLPWSSPIDHKISAFDAITAFLEHLKLIFAWEMKNKFKQEAKLSDFETVVTVPASFDEDARRLIYEATQKVGLKKLSLLEEPQAALYSWISDHEKKWREEITPGDLILVCDVGGGTTDFSLVCVGDDKGKLCLERISVGKHLLLGGDNMDHTLAYYLKNKLEENKITLDKWQYLSLVGQVKEAKEKLFNHDDLEEIPISIASKGSSLFAKTKTVSLTKKEVEKILVEGFFPLVSKNDHPSLSGQTALQDFGLHYETQTAITKHLGEFLVKSAKNIASSDNLKKLLKKNNPAFEESWEENFIKPTALLFNGGIFKAKVLRTRILDLLKSWDCSNLKELPGYELDLAVSKGATYYAKTKKSGKGIKIQAGTARSYYLGIESNTIAIPGVPPTIKGLCIVPQGTEEGTQLASPKKQFGLMTGNEVQFRFFSSSVRAGDGIGHEIEEANQSLMELPPMKVKLESDNKKSELVPVLIDSCVNDVGMLELSMKNVNTNKKWNLEFNIRSTEG